MTLWLYKHVVIPQVTYAAVVRWSRIEADSFAIELKRLQRVACIMISGAMRIMATKVMEIFPDLPTLNTVVEAAVLIAAYSLLRPDRKDLESPSCRKCAAEKETWVHKLCVRV